MLKRFQNAKLGEGFEISSTDLFLDSRKETMIMKRLHFRHRDKQGIGNTRLRCLSIAAYLRCLIASIESAPSAESFDTAVANISSIKVLT